MVIWQTSEEKLTAVTNAVEAQTSIMSVAMDALGNNFQQATKSMIESNKNALILLQKWEIPLKN